jgi:hypothetical protein
MAAKCRRGDLTGCDVRAGKRYDCMVACVVGRLVFSNAFSVWAEGGKHGVRVNIRNSRPLLPCTVRAGSDRMYRVIYVRRVHETNKFGCVCLLAVNLSQRTNVDKRNLPQLHGCLYFQSAAAQFLFFYFFNGAKA